MNLQHAAIPELRLLLLFGRPAISSEDRAKAGVLLRDPVDWDRLILLAQAHGLLPLLHHHLRTFPDCGIPDDQRHLLGRSCRHNALRNLALSAELLRLLGQFGQCHIDALTFKGPALARDAYGDTALRTIADLDLLVRPGDILQVQELMMQNGYKPEFEIDCGTAPAFAAGEAGLLFNHPARRFVVETHWSFMPPFFGFRFDRDGLFGRSVEVEIESRRCRTLCPADHLLALAVHGLKHCWGSLRLAGDIVCLIEAHPELDWDEILARARTARCHGSLLTGLSLARTLFKVQLPGIVTQDIANKSGLRAFVDGWCSTLLNGDPQRLGVFAETRHYVRSLDDAAQKVGFVLSLPFSTSVEDWMFNSCMKRMPFVIALLRPFRLVYYHVFSRRFRNRRPLRHGHEMNQRIRDTRGDENAPQ